MAEPGTAAGICAGAAVALPCSLLGAQTDAMVVGLIAAVLISFWLEAIDDRKKAFLAVLTSSLVAAYASPPVAKQMVAWFPAVGGDADGFRLACAFGLGALGPTIIPKLLKRAERKVEDL